LKALKIPLPPLEEQQKIAAILDAADSLSQKDQHLIEHYTALSQSLLLEMFGDPVGNQYGFEKGTIRDLLSTAKYGTSSKAQEDGEYPYLRMNNITYDGEMDFSSLKYINLDENDKPKYLVKKGDILFNRTNSKELVGKTGLYNDNREMAIAGYLIRVRTNDKANPYFIWAYLNSGHGKVVLKHMCKSIVGMANINAQELQNIKILLPPITLQNQFAEIIQAIEAQKQQAQASLEKPETLFNSLLQRAFKGELTA
jgi:type I restriction enzyme S subunit